MSPPDHIAWFQISGPGWHFSGCWKEFVGTCIKLHMPMAHASAYFCSILYKLLLILAGQTKQKTKEWLRLLLMRLARGKGGDMHTLPLACVLALDSCTCLFAVNPAANARQNKIPKLAMSAQPRSLTLTQCILHCNPSVSCVHCTEVHLLLMACAYLH